MPFRHQHHPGMNLNDLDFSITHKICQNFDVDRSWELLAGAIGYSTSLIQGFELEGRRPDGSPTKKLLWDWGTRGGTVRDLYDKLALIDRMYCMRLLEHIMKQEKDEKKVVPDDKLQVSSASSSLSSSDNNLLTTIPPDPSLVSYNPNNLPKPKARPNKNKNMKNDVNMNLNTESDGIGKGGNKQFNKVLGVGVSDQGAASFEINKCHADGPASNKVNLGAASSSVRSMDRVKSALAEYGSNANYMPDLTSEENEIARVLISTPMYTYKELNQATGGFSASNILGQGKFGCVYLGLVKNTKCAIKKLTQGPDQNDEENSSALLATELKALSRYHHENIVSLYGYTLDGDEVCLVYQYMPNGSLDDCLHGKRSQTVLLSWEQRLSIVRGAACGLQYLHKVDREPVIHGDIKSANILLDKHFEAKIADLGLAKHATSGENGKKTHITHITKKSVSALDYRHKAYCAPELKRGNVSSVKGDTFAFGVVMFETLTGEEPYDERREGSVDDKFLVDYIQDKVDTDRDMDKQRVFQDRRLQKDYPTTMFVQLFDLADRCTARLKKDRPLMEEVYTELERVETAFNGQEYNNIQEFSMDRKQSISKFSDTGHKPDSMPESTHMSYTSSGGYTPGLKTGLRPLPKVNIPQANMFQENGVSPIDLLSKDGPLPIPFQLQVKYDEGKNQADKEKIMEEENVKKNPEYVNSEMIVKNMKDMYMSDPKKVAALENDEGDLKNPAESVQDKSSGHFPASDPEKAKVIDEFDKKNIQDSEQMTAAEKKKLAMMSEEKQGIENSDVNSHEYENVKRFQKDEIPENTDEKDGENKNEEVINFDREYAEITCKANKGNSSLNDIFNTFSDMVDNEDLGDEAYDYNYDDGPFDFDKEDSETSTITESINNDAVSFNSADINDDELFDQGGQAPGENDANSVSETDADLNKHQNRLMQYQAIQAAEEWRNSPKEQIENEESDESGTFETVIHVNNGETCCPSNTKNMEGHTGIKEPTEGDCYV